MTSSRPRLDGPRTEPTTAASRCAAGGRTASPHFGACWFPSGSKIRNQNIHVFHEYVPVSDFSLSVENERYILLLGAPWHVKGVDLLLRAFDSLPDGYHGRLRIVGWMSEADISGLKKLIPNNKHVTFEKPVFYEEALRLIGKCDFLVLPSRTEAMGRVLMEARAHGKAVIGSTADGIPNYITHNQTGLLFDSGCWETRPVH